MKEMRDIARNQLFCSVGSNARLYRCDNLELLQEMRDESVNLIYCDVLYNTGKRFSDYDDSLGSPKEAVEWYRPRFEEMRRVLANDGSLFIHCNWRLDSYLRILLDEIFGVECFRNRIYRKHSNERGFYKNWDSQVDTILYYVKNKDKFVFHEEYGCRKALVPLFENGYVSGRSEMRKTINGESIFLDWQNKHWIVSPEVFNELAKENQIVVVNKLPYRFSASLPKGNLWAEDEMLDRYSRQYNSEVYDTPKPEPLIRRIIETCSNPGDIVADFFLGSGTTAVVAVGLNRKFIGCDIKQKACQVTLEKLRRLVK